MIVSRWLFDGAIESLQFVKLPDVRCSKFVWGQSSLLVALLTGDSKSRSLLPLPIESSLSQRISESQHCPRRQVVTRMSQWHLAGRRSSWLSPLVQGPWPKTRSKVQGSLDSGSVAGRRKRRAERVVLDLIKLPGGI